jgi:Holliday junction DNA helicase RuvB
MDFDFLGMITTMGDLLLEKTGNIIGLPKLDRPIYHSDTISPVKFDFTPKTLDEYIGQTNVKLRINTYIKKVNTIKPIHLIISGTRGHGKSTLAYIIADMLDYEINTYVGGSFTKDNLIKFLVKMSDSPRKQILFIDEIHGLSKEITEYMLPILQSFILPEGNLKLKPFIMIGATTNLEILQKVANPFVDRCDVLELETYTEDDIIKIIKQINDKLYFKNIDAEVYNKIANNSRYNPRTSISIFLDFLVEENIDSVLKSRQIVKDSLTVKDIIVLKHLAEIGKPVGVEVLAIITNQTKQTYMEIEEPFLLANGFISRTSRGRLITEKGKLLLQEVMI